MKAIIFGAGAVGFQLAKVLIAEKYDVVIIEKDPERARFISSKLDCIVINQEGTLISTLKDAGAEDARFFISVTNSDEVNIVSCGVIATEFNVPIKIARVRNVDYSRSNLLKKNFMGIDYIVNPEVEAAKIISNTVALGASSDVMMFENTDVQIRNFVVSRTSFFFNKPLKKIKKYLKERFLIAGVVRNEEFIIPSGETVIQENDNIYIFAEREDLSRLFIDLGRKSEKNDSVIIVGGTMIGALVCEELTNGGTRVALIDKHRATCEILSEKFPDALVIHSDISEEGVFEEEQLEDYDLIITATNNEELNILSSVYAKSLGVKRAMALVTKSGYTPIAKKLNIDSIVSPKSSTVDAILKFVRRGDIKSVHSLFNEKAEVIEYHVDESSPARSKKVMELKRPEGTLILSVIRGGENKIPDGNFVIEAGDRVITIAARESVERLAKVFTGGEEQ
jgi:trk system potassium uptake protein TrkA